VPYVVSTVTSAGFSAATSFAAGTNPFCIASGDFNGDSITDLAVANYSSNDISILIGNGNGSFQPAGNYACRNRDLFHCG
jgi:hypothetical protein